MHDVDILWLPSTHYRFGLLAYNVWHAHPGDVGAMDNKPLCKTDCGGMSRGLVWNKPVSPLITAVCKECKRVMDMWEMAE